MQESARVKKISFRHGVKSIVLVSRVTLDIGRISAMEFIGGSNPSTPTISGFSLMVEQRNKKELFTFFVSF